MSVVEGLDETARYRPRRAGGDADRRRRHYPCRSAASAAPPRRSGRSSSSFPASRWRRWRRPAAGSRRRRPRPASSSPVSASSSGSRNSPITTSRGLTPGHCCRRSPGSASFIVAYRDNDGPAKATARGLMQWGAAGFIVLAVAFETLIFHERVVFGGWLLPVLLIVVGRLPAVRRSPVAPRRRPTGGRRPTPRRAGASAPRRDRWQRRRRAAPVRRARRCPAPTGRAPRPVSADRGRAASAS